jgi:hypothetical protein
MVLVVMYSACVVGHRHARSSSFGPSAGGERENAFFFLFSVAIEADGSTHRAGT